MSAPPAIEEEAETEDWLTTYADAITLLMAFFVMLLNFSKIDIPAFEKAATGIKNELGLGNDVGNPIQKIKDDITDIVYELRADEVVQVETDEKGITIELASSAFYQPGSAEFRPEALAVLQKIGELLIAPRYRTYIVEVEGHTDDDPIHTDRFPSNWELSAGRATRVVRAFIEQGMDFRRLKAIAYAETRPKRPNRQADGTPIPDNMSENRRVVIDVYPMSLDEREEIFGDRYYGMAGRLRGNKQEYGSITGLPIDK